jgi:16S rRNA (guanine527-N7)-methyltransferase
LGSGGGSPAIPLALAASATRIVMVESRVRKASFLREVLRELGLNGAVEARRFEDVASDPVHREHFPLLSVRAVRLDPIAFSTVEALLAPNGCAALFRTLDAPDPPAELPPSLHWQWSRQLIPATHSALTLVRKG